MGINRHKTSTDFICDVCGAFHVEQHGSSYDETRAAIPLVRQDGWSINRAGVTCPGCSVGNFDRLDDVLM
jgi:hypothetical protein